VYQYLKAEPEDLAVGPDTGPKGKGVGNPPPKYFLTGTK